METRNKVFLLDAMALIYRAHFAFSKNPIMNSKGMNTSPIYGFLNTLIELIRKEEPTHLAVVFDTKAPTFRSEIFVDYKANRERQPEDIQISIPFIKKILQLLSIKILEKDGFEADDVIGSLATQLASDSDTVIYMMTPDKDFAQLVSKNIFLYKPAFMGRGVDILGVDEVLKKFNIRRVDQVVDFLGLQGDSVDNIPGVQGVGPKTAQTLLEKYDTVEGIIENQNEIKGAIGEKIRANIDDAKMSKVLAKIKTDVDLNVNLNALKIDKPNNKELISILDELEFRTIKERLERIGLLKQAKDEQLSVFDNDNKTTKVKVDYKIIDENKVDSLIKKLKVQKEICFDTETSSLDIQSAKLAGIAFSCEEGKAYYVPTLSNTEEILKKLSPLFSDSNILLIGHNLKYDIQILSKYGILFHENVFDTMLAHYVISPEGSQKLDVLSENYLNHKCIPIEDVIGKKGVNQMSMIDIPVENVYEYACEDADITLRLKNIFAKEIEKKGYQKLFYEIEIPLLFVLANIEQNGVKIDSEFLKKMSGSLSQKIKDTERLIFETSGEEFNVGSPKQLGIILFDKLKITENPKKTKSGQYSTSEDVLNKLSNEHEIVEQVLSFREFKKLQSTYVDALPDMVSKTDGLIHTDYAQAVTATGRLSSNNPNLQNIPIRTDLGRKTRQAFIPRYPKNIILAADYSQIELRIIAEFSKDRDMISAFKENKDIHSLTAAKVFKVDLDKVTPDMRRRAKEVNFGIIYGISAFGLSQNLNIPRSEAKEIIDSYFEEFKSIKEYMDNSIEKARKNKYVETIFGRRRYLRDIDSRNFTLRGFAERNAINSPIQGSAADIIKLAMIKVLKWINDNQLKSKMIMQVHDELVFDIHNEELDLFKKNIKSIMENVIETEVPLKVDIGHGKNWLEAH